MNCTLLALDGCPLSSVSGPLEILSLANSLVDKDKQMSVQIVGESKQVDCLGEVQLKTHDSIADINHTDILIIGAIGHPAARPSGFEAKTLAWIQQQYSQGAVVVSICSGAFVLAATGLLDGKRATTHWATEGLFRQRYPKVHLQSEQMITQDGNLYCSGGASAYQDMSLLLVRQYYGNEVAHQVAKRALMDMDRHNQQVYAQFTPARQHQDRIIHNLQDWLKSHASENVSIAALAEQSHLSERQLKRRFKQATGISPLAYIQGLRVETAKHALETSKQQIETVAREVGYEDVRFFRQLFKRLTGLSPSDYRSKFALQILTA